MTGARILTEAQLYEMAELREAGETFRNIRRHFARQGTAVSASTIAWQCLRLGADLPPEKRRPSTVVPGAIEGRDGNIVRRFSPAEDSRILELRESGLSNCAIARRIGRRPNSVTARLMTLARREERELDAWAGQPETEERDAA